MRLHTATSLFLSALLTTTLAAPTRTQCRCKLVSEDTPAQPDYTPSTAHWAPSDPTPSAATPTDLCSTLGAELQSMQHSHPDVYNSYLGDSWKSQSGQKPIPTTVLMRGGGGRGDSSLGSKARLQKKIVCYEEREAFAGYHFSFVSLWMLHVVVAVLVIACVVEGVYLGLRLFKRRDTIPDAPRVSEKKGGGLRLSGGERPLLAIPASDCHRDSVFSPGADKKKRAYESTRYFVKQSPGGRREFIAYDDEDDDEANRPVM